MTGVAERLARIREEISSALERAGDPDRHVTIVAVTKSRPWEVVREVLEAGIRDIGESRVQEALSKAPEVDPPVRWHMIGHLQRNKVAKAVRLFDCIHSVDRIRLVEALARTDRDLEVFLQINVSGEGSKQGAPPERARALWQAALGSDNLTVAGLMTMAPLVEADAEEVRPVFRGLRELRDELDRTGDGPPLRGLSMGMSQDFAVALEEGATHLRLGTALAGPIVPRAG